MAQWKETLEPYVKVQESVKTASQSVSTGEDLIVGVALISDAGPGTPTLISGQKEFLKVFASKDIKDHVKFNNEFSKDNPGLVERYKKSKWNDMTTFLICEEGYIQVGKIGNYKGLLYDSSKITKTQECIINMYNEAEYDIEDLKTDRSEERGKDDGR